MYDKNAVQQHAILYNFKAIQRHDFVCDNNDRNCVYDTNCDHMNNQDNAYSIQAIVATTLDNNNDGCINHVYAMTANSTVGTVDTVVNRTDLAFLKKFKSRVKPVPDLVTGTNLFDLLPSSSLLSLSLSNHSPNISLSLSSLLPSSLLPLLLNKFRPTAATNFDVDPDTVIEFTIVHHRCALYLYVVPIL